MLTVLVHGSMDRGTSFGSVARVLGGEGLEILAPDRRGYGTNRARPGGLWTDVEDVLASLGRRPAALVGHSYGGHVALGVAARAPELVLAAGVFETPLAWLPAWPRDTGASTALGLIAAGGDAASAAEAFVRRLAGDAAWERLPPSVQTERRAEGAALVADLQSIRAAPYDLRSITVPVVVARSSDARPQHLTGYDHLLAGLPAAEGVVLGEIGHRSHVDHPAEFARFVLQVVERAQDRVRRAEG